MNDHNQYTQAHRRTPRTDESALIIFSIAGLIALIVFLAEAYFIQYERCVKVSQYYHPRFGILRGNTNRVISDRKLVFSFLAAFSAALTKLIFKLIAFRKTRKLSASISASMLHLFFHAGYPLFILTVIALCFSGFPEGFSGPLGYWYDCGATFKVFISMIIFVNVSAFGILNYKWYKSRYLRGDHMPPQETSH